MPCHLYGHFASSTGDTTYVQSISGNPDGMAEQGWWPAVLTTPNPRQARHLDGPSKSENSTHFNILCCVAAAL